MNALIELILGIIQSAIDAGNNYYMIILVFLISMIELIMQIFWEGLYTMYSIIFVILDMLNSNSHFFILLEELFEEIRNFDLYKWLLLNIIIPIMLVVVSIIFLFKKIESNENINSDEIPNDWISESDLNFLLEIVIEFFYIGKWILLPICLYFSFIYMLHAILGLYSVYVDYFQKNPDHSSAIRAFLPAMFIFYLILFIFSSLIFFSLSLYLHYILWLLFL
jgi:hypothetical protein